VSDAPVDSVTRLHILRGIPPEIPPQQEQQQQRDIEAELAAEDINPGDDGLSKKNGRLDVVVVSSSRGTRQRLLGVGQREHAT
jgi:hypothetical protein